MVHVTNQKLSEVPARRSISSRSAATRSLVNGSATHPRTVSRLRERAATVGVLAALDDRPRPGAAPKLDGTAEAVLAATACAAPPAGQTRWTTLLLAGRLVALEVVDAISDETVRRY